MTNYKGYCAFCKHYHGKVVGQCKHHMSFVHREEYCEDGELTHSNIMQLTYGGVVSG